MRRVECTQSMIINCSTTGKAVDMLGVYKEVSRDGAEDVRLAWKWLQQTNAVVENQADRRREPSWWQLIIYESSEP